MTPTEMAAVRATATRAARALDDSMVADMRSTVEAVTRAVRGPGAALMIESARTAQSAALPKLMAPMLAAVDRQLADFARVHAQLADLAVFPKLAAARVTLDLAGIDEAVKRVAKLHSDALIGMQSALTARLPLPKIRLPKVELPELRFPRFEIPAIHLRPPPEPGTILGDLLILDWDRSTDAERTGALDRLVAQIPWKPRGESARLGLLFREVQQQRPRAWIVKDLLRAALILALGQQDQPQPHRFGRRWYTDADGRRTAFVPNQLPVPLFWEWLQAKTCTVADRIVLEEPYASPRPPSEGTGAICLTPLTDAAGIADPATQPEYLAVGRDEAARWRSAVVELLACASPGQKRLVIALYVAQQTNPHATFVDAATRLGISPSTARVQRRLLFERLGLDRKPSLADFLAGLRER